MDGYAVSHTDIASHIRAILGDGGWFAIDTACLADDDDLYAAGLTSHGSVALMLALEERFDIEFPETLLRRRTFESVAAIAAAVTAVLAARPAPGMPVQGERYP
jgi:acyl carrier protein